MSYPERGIQGGNSFLRLAVIRWEVKEKALTLSFGKIELLVPMMGNIPPGFLSLFIILSFAKDNVERKKPQEPGNADPSQQIPNR